MIAIDPAIMSRLGSVMASAELWVHRKGAMSAQQGQPRVLPGSMGSPSFHVEGRGCEEALRSSAHAVQAELLSRGALRGASSATAIFGVKNGRRLV